MNQERFNSGNLLLFRSYRFHIYIYYLKERDTCQLTDFHQISEAMSLSEYVQDSRDKDVIFKDEENFL